MPALIRRFHEAKVANSPNVTCWGTGSPMREFLHVDDLGAACVYALENYNPYPNDPVQHLNVGTGIDLSIKELAELVKSTVGFNGEIIWDHTKPDGTPKKQLDVQRIQNLGWHHKIELSEGIASTYRDFLTTDFRG
jgi:GDP-L-fucose synthase